MVGPIGLELGLLLLLRSCVAVLLLLLLLLLKLRVLVLGVRGHWLPRLEAVVYYFWA